MLRHARVLGPLVLAAVLPAQALPTIADKTSGLRAMPGFLDLHWDAGAGKLWMTIDALERELLYCVSLASGLGSNPVGLDRGQVGDQHVVVFERIGPKVLMVARNYRYRATSDNPRERRAVAESFAPSVLWGFEVAAASDGEVLVDATPFFLRDAPGIVQRLKQGDQGTFKLDGDRSALYLPHTRAFPDNVEVEATLTYTSGAPGSEVRRTAAVAEAVTLRQHHSLIRLPDDGYVPRPHDPRVGFGNVNFQDYGAPIDAPLRKRWIRRHRLQKKDPAKARSEPVVPIVYYLDPGVPEPVRSALRQGASWWAKAFEAAGFVDAFRVEDLPEGADPMDVRYDMIHWVHRETRGWSYGGAITDPRTGEILKGNVLLGSLRVRQDHMLLHGLGRAGEDGCGAAAGAPADYLVASSAEAVELSLARLRQLAAHEVGHTLGLSHNFAASTYDDRASVMDYPAPRVEITDDGSLDLGDAYGVGVGSYDVWAIRYGYTEFAPGVDGAPALAELVADGTGRYLYISDADARPAGAAHPLASLWDNGADPIAALGHAMRVRAIGLQGFGVVHAVPGEPLAMLEERLVPLYLHHRYQVDATAKSLGGLHYRYAVAGEAGGPSRVAANTQRAALAALLGCLTPECLVLPDRIVALIPPHPPGYGGEAFGRHTGAVLDPMAMAATAADQVVGAVLQPQRAARLIEQHARDPEQPGFSRVVSELIERSWDVVPAATASLRAMQRVVQTVVVERLLDLAADGRAAPDVRAVALLHLQNLARQLGGRVSGLDVVGHAQRAATLRAVTSFLERPGERGAPRKAHELPPGAPIGIPK